MQTILNRIQEFKGIVYGKIPWAPKIADCRYGRMVLVRGDSEFGLLSAIERLIFPSVGGGPSVKSLALRDMKRPILLPDSDEKPVFIHPSQAKHRPS
jgi:hypothetical protein